MTEQKQVTIPMIDKKLTITTKGNQQPVGELRDGDVWMNPQSGLCYTYTKSQHKWVALGTEADCIPATPRYEVSPEKTHDYERSMNIVANRTAVQESEYMRKQDALKSPGVSVYDNSPRNRYSIDTQLSKDQINKILGGFESGMYSKKDAINAIGTSSEFSGEIGNLAIPEKNSISKSDVDMKYATKAKPHEVLPANPREGDQWYDVATNTTYTYDSGMTLWVCRIKNGQMRVKYPNNYTNRTTFEIYTSDPVKFVDDKFDDSILRTTLPSLEGIEVEFDSPTTMTSSKYTNPVNVLSQDEKDKALNESPYLIQLDPVNWNTSPVYSVTSTCTPTVEPTKTEDAYDRAMKWVE